ncbi:pentapeptide repeat-containing protein [Nocardia sp. X0981]
MVQRRLRHSNTAWLTEADIRRAEPSGAGLRKVQGRGCHTQHAVFHGADLQRADLSVSELEGAEDMVVDPVDVGEDTPTRLPSSRTSSPQSTQLTPTDE